MKKSELIEMLHQVEGDPVVILQKDSEGNGYSPCAGVDGNAWYEAETTWYGEVYPVQEPQDGVPCIVLWPTN